MGVRQLRPLRVGPEPRERAYGTATEKGRRWTHTLVYDHDCGGCTTFRRAVELLDSRGRLSFASIDQAERDGLLDCVPEGARHSSFHLAARGGEVLSGAGAIPSLAGLLPAGRLSSRLIASAPGGLRSVAFVYSVFSRWHDAGSCGTGPEGR